MPGVNTPGASSSDGTPRADGLLHAPPSPPDCPRKPCTDGPHKTHAAEPPHVRMDGATQQVPCLRAADLRTDAGDACAAGADGKCACAGGMCVAAGADGCDATNANGSCGEWERQASGCSSWLPASEHLHGYTHDSLGWEPLCQPVARVAQARPRDMPARQPPMGAASAAATTCVPLRSRGPAASFDGPRDRIGSRAVRPGAPPSEHSSSAAAAAAAASPLFGRGSGCAAVGGAELVGTLTLGAAPRAYLSCGSLENALGHASRSAAVSSGPHVLPSARGAAAIRRGSYACPSACGAASVSSGLYARSSTCGAAPATFHSGSYACSSAPGELPALQGTTLDSAGFAGLAGSPALAPGGLAGYSEDLVGSGLLCPSLHRAGVARASSARRSSVGG
eukprot:366046-Chlamydomonas_euryale.AAC.7